MAINVKDAPYFAQCDWDGSTGTDDAAAIQAAIADAITNNEDIIVPGLALIGSTLTIDRPVDDPDFDRFFTIRGGGGFVVDSAMAMFSSTISFTNYPVTQLVRFEDVSFEATSNSLAAFVLDDARFLRTSFQGCSFSKIRCLEATTYTQSLYFYDCNVRRWAGSFFKGLHLNYDIQVIGGLYEAGETCFDMVGPNGCKFETQIEGMSDTALKLYGCAGVDISCYLEANGVDFDCRNINYPNHGVNIHGCFVSRTNAAYGFKWGAGTGLVSTGNVCLQGEEHASLHDLEDGALVAINDAYDGTAVSNQDALAHIGYRQGTLPALTLRSANSASFTVSEQIGTYVRIGNHVTCYFTCKLTSNGTHPADAAYITAGLPFVAAISSALCGRIEVVGVGSADAYLLLTSPVRAITSSNVLPANVSTDFWTVRGTLSYVVT